ncbi:hypothetical protein AK812_SmicGene26455 [Symbiodinium microadriaticum]|uniref:Uncharacterized protein n=1 Tax=Symbiodinium microadriaticum TaxID=2951 RepID=A0A1Q9D9E8_SYMMI|nr:hypothetical protein AK812_SmicGene26455 [Symbiodinium microadriaticum]
MNVPLFRRNLGWRYREHQQVSAPLSVLGFTIDEIYPSVVEEGKHDELLSAGGAYFQLVACQLSGSGTSPPAAPEGFLQGADSRPREAVQVLSLRVSEARTDSSATWLPPNSLKASLSTETAKFFFSLGEKMPLPPLVMAEEPRGSPQSDPRLVVHAPGIAPGSEVQL